MQSRSLEKYVWSVSFVFCFAMLMTDSASAGGGQALIAQSQNPVLYIIGLTASFVGAKIFSQSGPQF